MSTISKERRLAIIVAAVLGVLAVLMTNIYFKQKEARLRPAPAGAPGVQVLVAARDISRGATVDYDMLAFKAVPVNFVEPKVLQTKEAAVGKTAAVTISAGEQILPSKLTTPGKDLTLAVKTPPGKRAFTITLEETSAVGGMLSPGDHVDVLAIFTKPSITLTLFQDVLILAVGREMVPTKRKSSSGKEPITLALTPQEVQVLTVAMDAGKIRLTLRPRSEIGKAMSQVDLSNLPPAIDLNTLIQLYIGQFQQMSPAQTVEVIRGLKKETTAFPAQPKER